MNSIFLLISFILSIIFFLLYVNKSASQQEQWLRRKLKNTNTAEHEKLKSTLDHLLTQKTHQPHTRVAYSFIFFVFLTFFSFLVNGLVKQTTPLSSGNKNSTNDSSITTAPDLDTAIKDLEKKLQENPNNLEGLLLYSRTMIQLRRIPEAYETLQKAYRIAPENALVLTDLAEVEAYQSGNGNFLGKPEELLKRALTIDPNQQKALWLQGMNHFEKKQYNQAIELWSHLLTLVENDKVKNLVSKQLQQAKAQLNASAKQNPSINNPIYQVSVTIDDKLKTYIKNKKPVLFVFAQAVDGPPMPIAAKRIEPPLTFPITVTLSNSDSLMEQRKLDSITTVMLSAKLSFSGSATPADDDIITDKKESHMTAEDITILHLNRIRQ